MDFKESGFMYALGGFIVVFVLAQSLFFLIRAWKQGKKLGLSTAIMRGTVTQSVRCAGHCAALDPADGDWRHFL